MSSFATQTTRIIRLRVFPVGPISIHPQNTGLTPSVITVRNDVLTPRQQRPDASSPAEPGHPERQESAAADTSRHSPAPR
ncbi:MAG: hypothetical protein JOY84_08340 [Curvibacter sp.]|nr:hypothetical protein [Curvibacter sp.]